MICSEAKEELCLLWYPADQKKHFTGNCVTWYRKMISQLVMLTQRVL